MNTRKEGVAVWRLDENRYAIGVDQLVRYVGSQAECERRAEILVQKNTRDAQGTPWRGPAGCADCTNRSPNG